MKSFIFAALAGYVAAGVSLGDVSSDNVTGESKKVEMKPDNTSGSDQPAETKPATVPEKALWESETKITTTDWKDNKADKIVKDVFSWGNFDATMFSATFKDVLDTMGNDGNIQQMARGVKEKFKATYIAEEAQLPEVCEAGKKCRTDIRDALVVTIQNEWTTVVTAIAGVVERTIDDSRVIMEAAYKEAFSCEPGCACEFVENRYAYLISTIKEIDTSIDWYKSEISVRKGYIEALDDSCVRLNLKYDPKWLDIANEHKTKVDAIQDWQHDGYDLESLVDLTAFKAKYGFDYESHEFDRYFAGEDRTDLKDYQKDVQDPIDEAARKAAAEAADAEAAAAARPLDGAAASD